MNATSRRSLLGGAVALSLLMAACGSDSNGSSDATAAAETTAAGAETTAAAAATTAGESATTGAEAPDLSKLSATLNACGATFPQAFYEDPIDAFKEAASGVTINYGGGGSGKGRQDLADMVIDFACSDGVSRTPTWPRSRAATSSTSRSCSAPSRCSTTSTASTSCSCPPTTIAKIFQRDIKKWNDPAIAADNPGAKLPDTDIVVALRSDGSGTTENFTKYLDAASTGGVTWKLKSGSTVEWPADTQAGSGNGGVAQIVKSTKGAIGYVDLSDAKASGLKYASVQEPGRQVHRADGLEAASAAGDGIEVKDNLTCFTALNAEGRRRLPDHRADLVHRSTRSQDRQGQGRGRQGVPQVPAHRRPERCSRTHRLRAAAEDPPGQGRRAARQVYPLLTRSPTRAVEPGGTSAASGDRSAEEVPRRWPPSRPA